MKSSTALALIRWFARSVTGLLTLPAAFFFTSSETLATAPGPCVIALAAQAGHPEVAGRLADALQAADWPSIYSTLAPLLTGPGSDRRDELVSPVRLVLGHAALACGHNDVATFMFYSQPAVASSPASDSFAQWKQWASKYLLESSGSLASEYFYGDALARTGDYLSAEAFFERLLNQEITETSRRAEGVQVAYLAAHALSDVSLILSGCVHAYNTGEPNSGPLGTVPPALAAEWLGASDRWSEAALRYARAAHADHFSDPYNSRGLYLLLTGGTTAVARAAFEESLRRAGVDGMAHNGLAFAKVLGGESKDVVLAELHLANPALPFVGRNLAMIEQGELAPEFLTAMRGNIRELSFGLELKTGIPNLPTIGANFALKKDARGGAYVFLSDRAGGNFQIQKDTHSPGIVLGHWLTLNYPGF